VFSKVCIEIVNPNGTSTLIGFTLAKEVLKSKIDALKKDTTFTFFNYFNVSHPCMKITNVNRNPMKLINDFSLGFDVDHNHPQSEKLPMCLVQP
jgi:hypothetical protein